MVDVGQSDAAAMYQAGMNRTLQIEEGSARRCAAAADAVAEMFREQQYAAQPLQHHSGFGGFVSAHDLQDGFNRKGAELRDVLAAYRGVALRMKAAFLAAGGLYAEADAANAASIAQAGEGLPQ